MNPALLAILFFVDLVLFWMMFTPRFSWGWFAAWLVFALLLLLAAFSGSSRPAG